MRRWVVAGTLLAAVATTATSGAAQTPDPAQPGPGAVSVVPASTSRHADGPRLIFRDLRPGDRATDQAVVINSGNEEVRVAVYAADGQPTGDGGYGYTERGGRNTEVGSWLGVSSSELVLPAGGRAAVRLELQVGQDAYSGTNIGAVVVEPVDQPVTGQLPSRTRYAMPVTVVVEGGRQRPTAAATATGSPQSDDVGSPLQLRDLRPGPRGDRLCPSVVLGNGGAVTGRVEVKVRVDGLLTPEQQGAVTVDVPPAASAQRVQLPCVDRPLGPGSVSVAVDEEEDSETVFWAPWPFVLSLLFLLILIGALLTTFLREMLRPRKRQRDDAPSDAPEQPAE